MTTLAVLLEEPSAREMLASVLPRLLPHVTDIRFIVFDGKQDMMRELGRKLRGWVAPNTRFMVLRDQDSSDCHTVKNELVALCKGAGHGDALVRVACHELESFYLGDLAAVGCGLGLPNIATQQDGRKYRAPDALNNAKQELIRLTARRYQERAGSRVIAPHLRLDGGNRSRSFGALLEGVRRLVPDDAGAEVEQFT